MSQWICRVTGRPKVLCRFVSDQRPWLNINTCPPCLGQTVTHVKQIHCQHLSPLSGTNSYPCQTNTLSTLVPLVLDKQLPMSNKYTVNINTCPPCLGQTVTHVKQIHCQHLSPLSWTNSYPCQTNTLSTLVPLVLDKQLPMSNKYTVNTCPPCLGQTVTHVKQIHCQH